MPGMGRSTETPRGMLRASLQLRIWGGRESPATLCPRITNLCSSLIALSKPEHGFSVFKLISAVGIDAVMSRRKKDQIFSFLEVSLKGQRTEVDLSLSRGDVGSQFIYCFNRDFGLNMNELTSSENSALNGVTRECFPFWMCCVSGVTKLFSLTFLEKTG